VARSCADLAHQDWLLGALDYQSHGLWCLQPIALPKPKATPGATPRCGLLGVESHSEIRWWIVSQTSNLVQRMRLKCSLAPNPTPFAGKPEWFAPPRAGIRCRRCAVNLGRAADFCLRFRPPSDGNDSISRQGSRLVSQNRVGVRCPGSGLASESFIPGYRIVAPNSAIRLEARRLSSAEARTAFPALSRGVVGAEGTVRAYGGSCWRRLG